MAYSSGTYLAHVVEMILLGAGERCSFDRSLDTHMAEALFAVCLLVNPRQRFRKRILPAGGQALPAALAIKTFQGAA